VALVKSLASKTAESSVAGPLKNVKSSAVAVATTELVEVVLTATSLVVVEAGVVVGVQLTAKKAAAMAAIRTLLLFISLQGSAAIAEGGYYVTFCDFFQFLGWSSRGQNSIIIAMENNKKTNFNTTVYVVIYAYSLPHVTTHHNHLKIGKTNIKLEDYAIAEDKAKAIQDAANKRIRKDLLTSEVNYILEYTTLGIRSDGTSFEDHDVHNVLKRSGIDNIVHTEDKKYGEWFDTTLETVKNSIDAVKNGNLSLTSEEIVRDTDSPQLRKGSQTVALEKTLKAINKGKKHFLWDAKMRFGKTLTALEVARQMNYGKVLIITHRPEVNEDWFNDFNRLFKGTDYRFGSRGKGENIFTLQRDFKAKEKDNHANPFIYFASVQYLRHEVKSKEKIAIINEDWDMLIVDEADEGIKTTLADETISQIHRNFTLMLSGTPFNLLEDYNDDEIYSWDYTSEQELKERWQELYPNEPNPYYKLPRLSIFVYELNKYIQNAEYMGLYDKAFNFKEFFRTDKEGAFMHEKDVSKFLDLITTESESNFPYSKSNYRENLRHTLWMVPGVKEARALEKLLNKHPVFTNFNIANVAGDGNEEVAERKARKLVKDAITNKPLDNYSITISCGKMTRGVSVPEWTAVFMLNNISKAGPYLQTVFRGQTPWEYEGIVKSECFVFDFAPDRTLTVVADAMNIKKKRPTTEEVKKATSKFLNYCSVISATHGEMRPFSTQKLLQAIKKVAIQKVTVNGFDDSRLYNLENIEKCTDEELADFAELNKIVGQSKGVKDENKVKMADNGFTDEEHEKAKEAETKKKQKIELTPEEEDLLRRKKEIAEQRKTRISILRGISIRMPMMIYGCKLDQNGKEIRPDDEITLNEFINNVDDESWAEFMPEGVTKEMLRDKFSKYYDEEVFIGAGIDIRLRALAADQLSPSERVQEIGEIFKGFKNPDKETVLTPWHVVNLHISSTLGGADFNDIVELNPDEENEQEKIGLPNWVDKGDISKIWNSKEAKILEINSKSGLYPLLCAYNFYSKAIANKLKESKKTEDQIFRELWNEILHKNIFVLTKSPMAKTITERTLAGYTNANTNVVYLHDLINKLKRIGDYKNYKLIEELNNKFGIGEDMKFDAVVGNPPYQLQIGHTENQNQANTQWIYHYFQNSAEQVGHYTSLIYPFGGWFDAPDALGGFGKKILSDKHTLSIAAYEGTSDKRAWYRTDITPKPIFDTANLSAGVAIVLRDTAKEHDSYTYSNRVYSDNIKTVNVKDWALLSPSPDFTFANKLFGQKLAKRIRKGVFGIESNFVEQNPNKVSNSKKDWAEPIILYTNDIGGSAGRAKMYWCDKNIITKNTNLVDDYKVVTTSAYPKKTFVSGTPTIDNVQKRLKQLIEFLPSGSAFGSSRMLLFNSEIKEDCDNFIKYTKTRFFAYLVLQEPNRRSSIGFVIPDQDFSSKSSDIDWSKSLSEIDKQLYKKYDLTTDEVDFIEAPAVAKE
jgi:superfamily II DNA or RNA helicase